MKDTKKTTPKSTSARKGKAEGSDEVTAERVRAFLENPDAKESAKGRVRKLVGELYGALECDTLPETPGYYGLMFEQTQTTYHRLAANGTLEDAAREIYGGLAEAVNRHEPKDARLVRRLSAVLGDPKTDGETRHRIGYIMCDLSNETGTDDLHPELFPALARLYFRVSREAIRDGSPQARLLRSHLRELEAIAGK